MSKDLGDLDPDVQAMYAKHADLCAAEGIVIGPTQTRRTWEEQAAYYAIGRTVPGEPCQHEGDHGPRPIGSCVDHPHGRKVTNAPPGYSWHQFGRAYDVKIVKFPGDQTPLDVYDGPWDRVGELGEQAGLDWGGRWKGKLGDRPHFDHHGGLTLAQARAAHDANPTIRT